MTAAGRWAAAAVVVVAGAAALLLDVVAARDAGQSSEEAAVPGGTAGSGSPGAPGDPVGTGAASVAGPAADPDPAAELAGVASAAVAAWQVPDVDDRTAALAPLVTTAWLELSTSIDPARVPSGAVAGSRLRVESDGRALVDVTLTDGAELAVILLLEDERWLVAEILPTAGAGPAGEVR